MSLCDNGNETVTPPASVYSIFESKLPFSEADVLYPNTLKVDIPILNPDPDFFQTCGDSYII